MKLTSLIQEQKSTRTSVAGVSLLIKGHENRLYMIPETGADLDMIESKGGKAAFVQQEIFPFLESNTGIQWQYDKGNPSAGFVLEVDFDAIIEKITKGA